MTNPEDSGWHVVRAAASVASLRKVLWFFPVLLGGILAVTLAVDVSTNGRSLDAFGMGAPIVLTLGIVALAWMLRSGRLGVPPSAVRVSAASIEFRYGNRQVTCIPWDSSRLKLRFDDVLGSWNPKDPASKSHKYWMTPPRGAVVEVEESLYRDILSRASASGLSIVASDKTEGMGSTQQRTLIRPKELS